MTRQLNFLDMRPLARTTDHESSHRAADEAERSGLVSTHERRILEVLHDGVPRTAQEIADAAGMQHVQIARRLSAMAGRGMVVRFTKTGERLRWMAR